MENFTKKEEIRVWFDACFDLPHFGHANALRQARLLGDKLIVGVHSDVEINKHKGAPFYNENERYRLARALRWIDEMVEDVPYNTTCQTMDKYRCQICGHGDDLTSTADGVDSYQEVKDAGRFRVFGRTIGISTTNLIGRLLNAANPGDDDKMALTNVSSSPYTTGTGSGDVGSCYFTTAMISTFCEGRRLPKPGDKIVYVAGTFDIFHVGHLAFLEAAKALGTYLIVGIHNDATVSSTKGRNRPFLRLQERVLGALAYRVVDDVYIGAPYKVTSELLDIFKVDIVCHGRISSPYSLNDDPFDEPKKRGIFRLIDSDSQVTTDSLIERASVNRDLYIARNRKKEAKELAFEQAQKK